ncbi:MAG: Ppx/GppA phosphatase family protein [Christensenellales bacterium]
MKTEKELAVIDIGSNSIRLMLPPKTNGLYHKELIMTRLGQHMKDGVLVPDAIQRTVEAIVFFVHKAESLGFEPIAFATSAVREAKNKEEFLYAVKTASELEVNVISGHEEARLGFLGTGGEGMIDIGGGSTEIICKAGNELIVSSLQLGTVRTLDAFPEKDQTNPREIIEFAEQAICPAAGLYPRHKSYCAVGGTATALSAVLFDIFPYDPYKVHGTHLKQRELEQLISKLCQMTPTQRRSIRALDPKRGDVIILGAAIMLAFMRMMKPQTVTVSETDAMEGFLQDYCEKLNK